MKTDVLLMTGVLQGAETAYSSGASESTPAFLWVHVVTCVFSFIVASVLFFLVLVVFRSLSVLVDFPFSWNIPLVFLVNWTMVYYLFY